MWTRCPSGTAVPRRPASPCPGVDGLCYLMSCREPIYGGKLEPKKVVTGILEKAKSAGFATSITVGAFRTLIPWT